MKIKINQYKVPLLQLGGLKRIFLSHIAFCKKKAACSAVRLYKFSTNFPSFPMNFYYQWNPDNRTSWTTPILLYMKIFNFHEFSRVFYDFSEFSTIFPEFFEISSLPIKTWWAYKLNDTLITICFFRKIFNFHEFSSIFPIFPRFSEVFSLPSKPW